MKKTIGLVLAMVLTAFTSTALSEQITLTFQEEVDDYAGTVDTSLIHGEPDTSHGSDTFVEADGSTIGDPIHDEGLVRFDNIFGSLPSKIPLGSSIISATLTLHMMQPGAAGSKVYRMLLPWTEDDTWNGWDGGIAPDGVEAAATEEVTLGPISTGTLDIDLASSLQAWSYGTTNNGWVFINGPEQSDGYQFRSSEYSTISERPKLTVVIPEPATLSLLVLGGLAVLRRRRRRAAPAKFPLTRQQVRAHTRHGPLARAGDGR